MNISEQYLCDPLDRLICCAELWITNASGAFIAHYVGNLLHPQIFYFTSIPTAQLLS